MRTKTVPLISVLCVLPWLLLAAPGMAQEPPQRPEQAPAKSRTDTKAQAIAREAGKAKTPGPESQPVTEGQPVGSQDGIAAAKGPAAKAEDGENNAKGAPTDSGGPTNTPAPPNPQQPRGAAPNDEELRKESQNPVANLISVPLQNNANMGIEPADRNQDVLNIQPVIPVSLSDNWQLIIRWIIPVIWQPIPDVRELGFYGLGDMQPTFFLSPKKPAFGKLIWGVGPALQLPTATNAFLGQGKLCLGPSVVALVQPGPWTIGALVNNVWSVAGNDNRAKVNQMLLQYFINYNMRKGWYLTSSPILTADWQATEGNRWVVPFGGGAGRVMRLGFQPVNISAQFYGNAVHPEGGSTWQMRFQMALLFPTGKH